MPTRVSLNRQLHIHHEGPSGRLGLAIIRQQVEFGEIEARLVLDQLGIVREHLLLHQVQIQPHRTGLFDEETVKLPEFEGSWHPMRSVQVNGSLRKENPNIYTVESFDLVLRAVAHALAHVMDLQARRFILIVETLLGFIEDDLGRV